MKSIKSYQCKVCGHLTQEDGYPIGNKKDDLLVVDKIKNNWATPIGYWKEQANIHESLCVLNKVNEFLINYNCNSLMIENQLCILNNMIKDLNLQYHIDFLKTVKNESNN